MDQLFSSFQSSVDVLVIREALNVFDKMKEAIGLFGKLNNLFKGVGKVFMIILIQHRLKKADTSIPFSNNLFEILKSFFYAKLKLDMSEKSISLIMANRFKREIKSHDGMMTLIKNGFSIFCHEESEFLIVEYLKPVHKSYIENVQKLSEQEFEQYKIKSNKTICQTLNTLSFEPKDLFPSKNYKNLYEIISSHFEISKLTNLFSTLGILLDSEPGLGKTTSLEFLASQGTIGEVLKIDMTDHLSESFESIKNKLFVKRKHNLVILFDELDKYIDYYIRETYIKETQKNIKEKIQITETKEEFYISQKEAFLYKLLGLLETNFFNNGIVIIFCANNFDSIFDDINIKHFDSLRKRFMRVRFERCDCNEFKEYIKFFNEKYKGTKWFKQPIELEKLLLNIRKDLSIPFRQLCHLNISSCYKVEKFIDAVNQWSNADITPINSLKSNSSTNMEEFFSGENERKSDGKNERESDGKNERESDGENERKSDGKNKKESDGENERESDGENERESDGENERESDGENKRKSDGENKRESDGENERESDGENEKESDGENERESDGENKRKSDGENKRKSDGENERESDGENEKESGEKEPYNNLVEYNETPNDNERKSNRKNKKEFDGEKEPYNNLVEYNETPNDNERESDGENERESDGENERESDGENERESDGEKEPYNNLVEYNETPNDKRESDEENKSTQLKKIQHILEKSNERKNNKYKYIIKIFNLLLQPDSTFLWNDRQYSSLITFITKKSNEFLDVIQNQREDPFEEKCMGMMDSQTLKELCKKILTMSHRFCEHGLSID